jgi:hypothetical protein
MHLSAVIGSLKVLARKRKRQEPHFIAFFSKSMSTNWVVGIYMFLCARDTHQVYERFYDIFARACRIQWPSGQLGVVCCATAKPLSQVGWKSLKYCPYICKAYKCVAIAKFMS